MITKLFCFIFLFTIINSQHISGVFTSFDSLDFAFAGSRIRLPSTKWWEATMSWSIDGSRMVAGDKFTLHMPCAFQFTTSASTIDLKVESTSYATCTLYEGEIVVPYSELQCTLLDSVTSQTRAEGSVTIPLVFDVGGSRLGPDLECAKHFNAGTNTVSFYDGDNVLSIQTNFEGGSQGTPGEVEFNARFISSLDRWQLFILGPSCSNSSVASGKLGFEISNHATTDPPPVIDCKTNHIGLTNSVNAWYKPEDVVDFKYSVFCNPQKIVIEYQNIPAGWTPMMDTLSYVPYEKPFHVYYRNIFFCADSPKVERKNEPFIAWTTKDTIDPDSDGKEVVIVTSIYTGSTTQVSTTNGMDSTKTIVVHVPEYVFITSTHEADTTSKTTLHSETDTPHQKTVVVHVPVPTTTTTTTCVGAATSYSTISAKPGETATVIVFNPVHVTETTTECYLGDQLSTQVVICDDCAIDTEIVWNPCEPETVLITSTHDADTTSRSTLEYDAENYHTKTIIVHVPVPTTTTTTTYVGAATSYSTISAKPGETATVIVFNPVHVTETGIGSNTEDDSGSNTEDDTEGDSDRDTATEGKTSNAETASENVATGISIETANVTDGNTEVFGTENASYDSNYNNDGDSTTEDTEIFTSIAGKSTISSGNQTESVTTTTDDGIETFNSEIATITTINNTDGTDGTGETKGTIAPVRTTTNGTGTVKTVREPDVQTDGSSSGDSTGDNNNGKGNGNNNNSGGSDNNNSGTTDNGNSSNNLGANSDSDANYNNSSSNSDVNGKNSSNSDDDGNSGANSGYDESNKPGFEDNNPDQENSQSSSGFTSILPKVTFASDVSIYSEDGSLVTVTSWVLIALSLIQLFV